MTSRILRTVLVLTLIGVWLVCASPVAHHAVVCFVPGEGAQIELGYQGRCKAPVSANEASPAGAVLERTGTARCETCVDLPLLAGGMDYLPSVIPAALAFQAFHAVLAAAAPMPVPAIQAPALQWKFAPPSHPGTTHRTVLLI